MDSIKRQFMNSMRKSALEELYQEKRRKVIMDGNTARKSTGGMDYERGEMPDNSKEYEELTRITLTALSNLDYENVAESLSRIRIIFAKNISKDDIEAIDSCGLIPEIISSLGVDLLTTCPQIISESLQ